MDLRFWKDTRSRLYIYTIHIRPDLHDKKQKEGEKHDRRRRRMDRGVGLILGLRTYRVFGNHTSQQGSIDYRWYGGRGGGGNGCDHKHEAKKKE